MYFKLSKSQDGTQIDIALKFQFVGPTETHLRPAYFICLFTVPLATLLRTLSLCSVKCRTIKVVNNWKEYGRKSPWHNFR
jgi:hypothetical protein